MTLDNLERGTPARIVSIDWSVLSEADGKRLRALGIDEGAEVAVGHRGMFGGRDPLSIRIGRAEIAVRRAHALAMTVEGL
ncbi:FeoA family protein [Qipengyuania sp. JC766]|uniref:FeoA family protein n=1 Tax=Qipengyuania sp. JC766 TaxID=3232139 RepID=UPI00345A70F1